MSGEGHSFTLQKRLHIRLGSVIFRPSLISEPSDGVTYSYGGRLWLGVGLGAGLGVSNL